MANTYLSIIHGEQFEIVYVIFSWRLLFIGPYFDFIQYFQAHSPVYIGVVSLVHVHVLLLPISFRYIHIGIFYPRQYISLTAQHLSLQVVQWLLQMVVTLL